MFFWEEGRKERKKKQQDKEEKEKMRIIRQFFMSKGIGVENPVKPGQPW